MVAILAAVKILVNNVYRIKRKKSSAKNSRNLFITAAKITTGIFEK